MLSEFIDTRRQWLLERARTLRAGRGQLSNDDVMEQGFALFLDQLIESLKLEQAGGAHSSIDVSGPQSGIPSHSKIGTQASVQGNKMHALGISIDDLVHSYGDLCHAIVDLAQQESLQLEIYEYRLLNHCLDNAIATAVTEFSFQHDEAIASSSVRSQHQHVAELVENLRNELGTATTALAALKMRELPLGGVTGSILERSLNNLSKKLDALLQESENAHLASDALEMFSLAEFMDQIRLTLAPCAAALSRHLTFDQVDPTLGLKGSRDALLAAITGLLQITLGHSASDETIAVNAYGRGRRILIDIAHGCRSGWNVEDDFSLLVARELLQQNDGKLLIHRNPDEPITLTASLRRRTMPT